MPSNLAANDEDVVVNCIEQRAAQFQNYIPVDRMETLQVVKYERLKVSLLTPKQIQRLRGISTTL